MGRTTALLALLALPIAAAPGEDPVPDGVVEVPARLLAGCRAIAGGETFYLAVHLDVPAGWHVFWENPGDRGLRTSASLRAPGGFAVAGPLYPGPQRLEQPGGLTSYVYEGDTLILFRVSAPRVMPPGPYCFQARASWLVESDVSFAGEAELELSLARASRTLPADAGDLRLLQRHQARLPRPLSDAGRVRSAWRMISQDTGEGARVGLELALENAERAVFFPALTQDMALLAQTLELDRDGAARLVLECEWLSTRADDRPRLQGVLRIDRGLEIAYFEVDLAGDPRDLGY